MTSTEAAPPLGAWPMAVVHELHILPPLRDGERVVWCGYLDRPDCWRRVQPALDRLLAAATTALTRLVTDERRGLGAGDETNHNLAGPPVPVIPAQWRVRITADCQESLPEWRMELLDESAWSCNGYDLRVLRDKLVKRLLAASKSVAVVPISPAVADPRRHPAKTAPITVLPSAIADAAPRFEASIGQYLARIDEQLERERRAAVEIETRIQALSQEQRALRAALAAYGRATSSDRAEPVHRGPRLSDEQVRTIRRRRAEGESHREIANGFGVSIESVRRLLAGQSYAQVP